MRPVGKAQGCRARKEGGHAAGWTVALAVYVFGGPMQTFLASICAQVAEFGVFFAATAALVAGALALR